MKFRWFLFLLFCAFSLPAQHSAKVSELEKKLSAALDDIEEINQLLILNKQNTGDAMNRQNLLAQQINSRKIIIQLLNQEIAVLDEEVGSKEAQIQTLVNELETKKQHYAISIRKMYLHKNNQDNLLFILSSQSFTQSYHRIMYLKAYSGWQKKQADEIVEKQKNVNREKTLLMAQRSNKLTLLNTRQSEENQLSREEENKKAEIKALVKNKKALQAELTKKQKQADAMNLQIKKMIAEEVLKSQKAAKVESGVNRKADVKGGYAMTESERTLSSSFAGNKGNLPFPLKGNYKVVAYFGRHQYKKLANVEMDYNGIFIETTPGNEARAVFNGVVSCVFTISGYKNCIIIRHGNYMTLYCNLNQVYVKQGESVNTGQALGMIYTDKEKGNYTLFHFEIWKDWDNLDPLEWIK